MLIKKKDVNDYFAARKASHPLSVKHTSVVAATKSTKVKRDSKASSAAGAIDAPGSSAPTLDEGVPPFTSERSFSEASPPVLNRWTKA